MKVSEWSWLFDDLLIVFLSWKLINRAMKLAIPIL